LIIDSQTTSVLDLRQREPRFPGLEQFLLHNKHLLLRFLIDTISVHVHDLRLIPIEIANIRPIITDDLTELLRFEEDDGPGNSS
jgi:hypothetical protein